MSFLDRVVIVVATIVILAAAAAMTYGAMHRDCVWFEVGEQ